MSGRQQRYKGVCPEGLLSKRKADTDLEHETPSRGGAAEDASLGQDMLLEINLGVAFQ